MGETIEKIGDCVIPSMNKLDGFLGSAKFAKVLPYGLGAALDFSAQLLDGKQPGEALIKAGAHAGIGIASAKIGAAIESFGGPIGAVAGAGLGFVLGVAGSMLFDKIYDDNIEEVGNWIGKTYEGAKKMWKIL